MKDNYTNAVKDGLLKDNAKICLEIARKGITLLKNEKEALPLKEKDYTGNNKVAFIGLSANHLVSGINQERSYGVISEMTSPYEAIMKLAGADANIYSETGIDLIGEKIPENCLWQDEACTKPGVIRTYGITPEDAKGVSMQEMLLEYILEQMKANQGGAPDMPASVGGAGKEFKGVASSEDIDDPLPIEIPWQNSLAGDMEGLETGTVCCIDKDIDFNCGTIGTDTNRSYKNSGNGTAFLRGNVYTWRGYIKAEETGDYDILLNAIGGNCAFKIKMDDRFIPVGYVELRENAQWAWGNIIPTAEGMEIQGARIYLEAGKAYEFMICGNATIKEKDLQIRLSWITPKLRKASYDAAIKLAEEADKVVFFLTDDYEVKAPVLAPQLFGPKTEPRMDIPAEQQHLLNDVRSVMKPYAEMILVNNHSKMYALGDIEPKCDAIVEMASPGQEGGKALAEILLGKVNPSGKVVVTYPY